MNLYMLVEGRRTEMMVYPAWLSHLLPQMERIYRPHEVRENNYYIVSGFGYPNLLSHIANCSKDMNKFKRYDYLLICLDTDELSASDRIREIENSLNHNNSWPEYGKVKVIAQRRCIETWFLGSDLNKEALKSSKMSNYRSHFDIFKRNPESMRQPNNYRGSIGDYHCEYLTQLMAVQGKIYHKRNPGAVLGTEYLDSLIRRTEKGVHLKTLNNFIKFCRMIDAMNIKIRDIDRFHLEKDFENKKEENNPPD